MQRAIYWTPVLYDVANALESVADPEARIDRVLRLMGRFVSYDRCALLEASPVLDRRISVLPEVSGQQRETLIDRLRGLLDLLSEQPLEHMNRHTMHERSGAYHLAVPITALGETAGIVFIERAAPAYEESHLAFLSVVAAQVGAYLAAVRADRELRASEARFRGLYAKQKRIESEREQDLELLEMFMGMLGHDLRNPLNAIKMAAEYVRLSDGEQLEATMGLVLSSTDRMARLIDQLLDLTRIRLAGGLPIERRHVDLEALCHRVIDELKMAHPGAPIRIEVEGDVSGAWDGDRMLQVVSNLVSNAVEHAASDGDITVRLTGVNGSVELVTHNPGAIPAETLDVLFQPFGAARARRKSDGLGLGLFITKQIIEAHGGSIEVHSSEPEGTTFTARLPR